jgi:hypothetical protein
VWWPFTRADRTRESSLIRRLFVKPSRRLYPTRSVPKLEAEACDCVEFSYCHVTRQVVSWRIGRNLIYSRCERRRRSKEFRPRGSRSATWGKIPENRRRWRRRSKPRGSSARRRTTQRTSRSGGAIGHVDLTHSACPIPVEPDTGWAICAPVGPATLLISWQGMRRQRALQPSKGRVSSFPNSVSIALVEQKIIAKKWQFTMLRDPHKSLI